MGGWGVVIGQNGKKGNWQYAVGKEVGFGSWIREFFFDMSDFF